MQDTIETFAAGLAILGWAALLLFSAWSWLL